MLRILLFLAAAVWAQSAGDIPANGAYDALRNKDYDRAVAQFTKAVTEAPDRAGLRKDFAYTLLKVGETTRAREQFAEAMRLDPADDHVALEYAFLCYETPDLKQTARRVFGLLRDKGNATAIEAFENVDRPLRDGIARWQAAVRQDPKNFSAHEELAKLAEQRDEFTLAAEHYEAALKLRPARRDLLLDLGRVWRDQGQPEKSLAAWIAASRGPEPRIAEAAKELLPARYPYVYEFEQALTLDPSNEDLRRELAYLHREMGNRDAARREFEILPERAPAPPKTEAPVLLNRALTQDDKVMAARSLEKGYLPDAARYLRSAYESDPGDFETILKLGWTYNALKQDQEAVRWFDLARRSPDAKLAEEASLAYQNLASSLRRFHTSFWMFPMVSTRWQNTFVYSQAKAELRFTNVPIRPYASIRFIGDLRGRVQPIAGFAPQYLSEQSAIVGVGAATPSWRGATLWFEVGSALHYRGGREFDMRGGLSFARRALARRWFAETNDDVLYVRRFNRDTLVYSQNRAGWTVSDAVQIYWNGNATVDTKREYWANTVETGPGARWRVNGVEFSANFLRGAYLKNAGNPYRPNYNDLRIGVWYAFIH